MPALRSGLSEAGCPCHSESGFLPVADMNDTSTKGLKRVVNNAVARVHQWIREQRDAMRTPGEVFTDVYARHLWGGQDGGEFCSGLGSCEDSIVGPYVNRIRETLRGMPVKPRIVDLGCGDFRVGRQFLDLCSSCEAIDVVEALIAKHRESGYDERVRFRCLDIVDGELPPGDVCFIRQVLQHLSNSEIVKVLGKLGDYRVVFITEHQPCENPGLRPNRDIVHGARTRLTLNSGVYVDRPPFNVFAHQLDVFMEVSCPGLKNEGDGGVIRVYRLQKPSRADA